MNLVIDDAEEVYVKDAKPRVTLGSFDPTSYTFPKLKNLATGRILLKGDNITLIQPIV